MTLTDNSKGAPDRRWSTDPWDRVEFTDLEFTEQPRRQRRVVQWVVYGAMVLGVVALIVLGPERLPKAARTAGQLIGRLQRYVAGVKADIERELHDSYLTYAMSTIMDRALPDVRDGLKPSQRRILVAMHDLNLTPGRKQIKCAKICGDTSGNYHPHGESVIYPTLVNLGQVWKTRHMLVDKQGNEVARVEGTLAWNAPEVKAELQKLIEKP